MIHLRKLVHVSGVAFAFIALCSPYLALAGIIVCLLAFFLIETVKPLIGRELLPIVYRDDELTGRAYEPLFYLISISILLIVSLYTMRSVCYVAIVVLTAGDGTAGIVGRALGKHRLPGSEKTWEGSIAGLAMAAALGFMFAGPPAIVGAAAGMAAEAYARRLENLSVVAAAFLAMAILYLL